MNTDAKTWGPFALVAAPLTTTIARLLSVPWDDQRHAKMVREIADAPVRSDLGATLVVIGAALSVGATIYLTVLARRHRPTLGAVGGVLAVLGFIGVACVGTKSLDAGQIVRHSSPDTAASILGHLSQDIPSVDLLPVIGMVGYALLAIGLYRDRGNPRVLPFLIGLGGAATMITSEGPIRALVLGSALVLLAGQTWLALIDKASAVTPAVRGAVLHSPTQERP